jgi:hypothetical protein
MKIEVNYNGIGHLDVGQEQTLYLVSSNNRPNAAFDIKIKEVTEFREVIVTFLSLIKKHLNYRPTSDSSAQANELYQSLRKSLGHKSELELQQELHHNILQKFDPNIAIGMDVVVTVTQTDIIFELFGKRGKLYSSLQLKSTLFEGTLTPGTTNICLYPKLISDLEQLTPRKSLRLVMGANIDIPEKFIGNLKKIYPFEQVWVRQCFLLTTATVGRSFAVPMCRMDLFNLMNYLRLNRGKQDDYKEFAITLKPGTKPQFSVSPYGWRYECNGENFQGDKSLNMLFFDHRPLIQLERIMPYVDAVQVNVMATSLPSQWKLDGENFCLLYTTSGFSSFNWNRRLQFESMLPKLGQNRNEQVFQELQSKQIVTVSGLVNSLSMDEKDVVRALHHELQVGNAVYNLSKDVFVFRSIFGVEIDIEEYRYLGRQDELAYDLVSTGSVEKFTKLRATGEIDFKESDENCSVVREQKKEGQEKAPEFHPRMILKTDGNVRSVGCDCAHWREYGSSKDIGGPCSHLRALWLQHCIDIELAKEMATEDDVLQTTKRFLRKKIVREVSLDIAGKKKKIIEEFAPELVFKEKRRRVVSVYQTDEQARSAYFDRCHRLEQLGFTSGG